MRMSLVSIVMPVYKAEQYLAQTLDGILVQTYTDWECLCVDDGSPDRSGEILDAYAAKDVRIRVFHRPNAGASAARNYAMDLVAGEFVMFSDADDLLHPQAIETLVKIQRDTGAELIRYGHREVREHTGVPRVLPDRNTCEVIDFVKSRRAPTHYAYCGVFSFLTRELADQVRWPGIPNGEDGLFAVICLKASNRSVVTDCPLTDYLKHPGSGTQDRSLRMYVGLMRYFRLVTEECRTFPQFRDFKGDLCQYVAGGLAITPSAWRFNGNAEAENQYYSLLGCVSESGVFRGIKGWSVRCSVRRKTFWPVKLCVVLPHRLERAIANSISRLRLFHGLRDAVRRIVR